MRKTLNHNKKYIVLNYNFKNMFYYYLKKNEMKLRDIKEILIKWRDIL